MLDGTKTTEDFEKIKTYVRFVNDNPFPVDVFSDSYLKGKICSVSSRSRQEAEVFPEKTSNTYYLIYHLTFHNAKISYNSSMTLGVPDGKTTTGVIPLLSDSGDKTSKISNDVYIYVNNDASHSLRLERGGALITLDGSDSYILNGKSSGVYILKDQLAVSSYAFSNPGTGASFSLPSEISGNFERGNLYSLNFNGSTIVSSGSYPMTLYNILSHIGN
jgi:hypothetical protein